MIRGTTIRGLGIGLFLAGAIYAGSAQFGAVTPSDNANTADVAALEKEIKSLQEQLARQNAEQPVKETTKPKETVKEEKEPPKAEPAPKPKAEEPKKEKPEKLNEDIKQTEHLIKTTLQVYPGASAYDIAKRLEDEGIIKNSVELELLLANEKYARSIQVGSFDINSDMSLEDIADTITKQ